jgi:predicted amidohydrolase
MLRTIRVVGVSYSPPPHDHRGKGVNLAPLAEVVRRVAREEKPQFICFPEICACGGPIEQAVGRAPEMEPFAAEVGKLAREVGAALVVPTLERCAGQVYNSVPVVDASGKLVLVYRKNFPTPGEMDAGISPGVEVPVAECDGVRVGAAVCFDANFPQVAAELERGRARVVFWPSMFWGGRLLEHWALRYGFYIVVAYGAESAVLDITGRYLVRRGAGTLQVQSGNLPPWAAAEINADREVYHLDYNQEKLPALRGKYGPGIEIEVFQPEAFFVLASRLPDVPVERIAGEFKLEPLRDYLARSIAQRDHALRTHGRKD